MNKSKSPTTESKQGFTVIEVMLVLAITGLMLVGIIGGTYASIAAQRYNDSVRSFSEFLRQLFSEVISPQSLGEGNSDQEAVYGKIAVFGLHETGDNIVYTATLVGEVQPPRDETGFIAELGTNNAHLFCEKTINGQEFASTLDSYTPMWEAEIATPNDSHTANTPLKGTLIIARSPASGTVRTAFTRHAYNIKDNCQGASNNLQSDLKDNQDDFETDRDLDFCIVSDNSRIVRDIRLNLKDAHNSSAINLIPADLAAEDGGNLCIQK